MTRSSDRRRPPWRKLLAEAPALLRLLAANFRKAPECTGGTRAREPGMPVIVIPAFLAPDLLTRPLRLALRACGYRPYGWRQGINIGARRDKFDGLLRRIDRVASRSGQKVALVGWSLGGLYAREAAKRRPGKVSAVITLGTPFSHGLRRNNAWKLYEAVNDHDVDHPPVPIDPDEKPPVPTVAIWSKSDGIVAPASASGKACEADRHIEVHCRHNELVSHPDAVRAVLRALRGRRAASGAAGASAGSRSGEASAAAAERRAC